MMNAELLLVGGIVAAVASAGCTARLTCSDVECPSLSFCVEEDGDPLCRCPTGYVFAGDLCVMDRSRPEDDGSGGDWGGGCGDDYGGDCCGVPGDVYDCQQWQPEPERGVDGLSEHRFPEACAEAPEAVAVDLRVAPMADRPTGFARDVDGDGHLDVAVSTARGRVDVLWGDGWAGFSARSSIEFDVGGGRFGGAPLAFPVGTGDGVAIAVGGDDLEVFVVEPTTREVALRARTLPGESPEPLAAADLNGDGIADLVVESRSAGELVVLLGLEDGTFGAPARVRSGEDRWALPWDADADGDLDLLFRGGHAANNGRGGFEWRSSPGVPTGEPSAGDLDQDGILDLVWTREECAPGSACAYPSCGDRLVVALGRFDGSVSVLSDRRVPDLGVERGRSDLLLDADGDGALDVALPSRRGVVLRPNDGNGNLGAPLEFAPPEDRTGLVFVAAGDFDEDGDADFLFGDGSGDSSVILRSRCIAPLPPGLVEPPRGAEVPPDH